MPGPATPRDRFGNLPRGYVAEVTRQPNVAWVHLRPGAPPVLIRRLPNNRLEVLAAIATETHHDTVRLPSFDIVTKAVDKAARDIA
ncbi:hypothetical protein FV226_15215 [Methylobacterium sp. WL12]|uniref:hypothetical protein n=1 Tax=Methylobacterium sp. WL12 TaxID=2603890 RepID=UPI0011D8A240|nr:hypothetical protein [Methylobacterium sp. WL12]TXM71412.1 hypothetical protein FV226_15215 [Methylobacterium sp. WL12]